MRKFCLDPIQGITLNYKCFAFTKTALLLTYYACCPKEHTIFIFTLYKGGQAIMIKLKQVGRKLTGSFIFNSMSKPLKIYQNYLYQIVNNNEIQESSRQHTYTNVGSPQ